MPVNTLYSALIRWNFAPVLTTIAAPNMAWL